MLYACKYDMLVNIVAQVKKSIHDGFISGWL